MSVTIADKLITAAQNEQRIYKKGYDKGVVDAGGTVVTKPEVEGNYSITANGSYSYTPPADKVFSKVNVEVAVSGGTEDLNDVLTAQEEKLAELSAILAKKADDGSYDEGYADGFEDGKAEGGDDTYYNEMWDEIQQNGTKTDYNRVFMGKGWNNVSFKPKHPIKPQKAQSMFESSGALSNEYVKAIDFSNCSVFVSSFYKSDVTELGVIDCRKASTGWNGIASMFAEALLLRKIEKLILPTDSGCTLDAFVHTDALEEITLEGTAHKAMNFRNSTKLNKASITSLINCLATSTSGIAVTFSQTAVNSAFETSSGANNGSTSAEWAALIATKSNWTISLV